MSYSMGYGNFGGEVTSPVGAVAESGIPSSPAMQIKGMTNAEAISMGIIAQSVPMSNPITIGPPMITKEEEARRRALKTGVVASPINTTGPTEQVKPKKPPIKLIIIGLATIGLVVYLAKTKLPEAIVY